MPGCGNTARRCDGYLSLTSLCGPQCVPANLTCDEGEDPVRVPCPTNISREQSWNSGNQTTFKILTPCSEYLLELDGKCYPYFLCNICRKYCAFEDFWATCLDTDSTARERARLLMKSENDGRCKDVNGCEVGVVWCSPKDMWDECVTNQRKVPSSTNPMTLTTRISLLSASTSNGLASQSTTTPGPPTSVSLTVREKIETRQSSSKGLRDRLGVISSTETQTLSPVESTNRLSSNLMNSTTPTTTRSMMSSPVSTSSLIITLASVLGALCLLFLLALICCFCKRGLTKRRGKRPPPGGNNIMDDPAYSEPELPAIYNRHSMQNPSYSYEKQPRFEENEITWRTSTLALPYTSNENLDVLYCEIDPSTPPLQRHSLVPPPYDVPQTHARYASLGSYEMSTLPDIPVYTPESQQTLPRTDSGCDSDGYSLALSTLEGPPCKNSVKVSPPVPPNRNGSEYPHYHTLYSTRSLDNSSADVSDTNPLALPQKNSGLYHNVTHDGNKGHNGSSGEQIQ